MTTPAFAKTALARLRAAPFLTMRPTVAEMDHNYLDVLECIDDMERRIERLRREVAHLRADLAPLAIIASNEEHGKDWCSLCKTWLPGHRLDCVLWEVPS